MELFAKNIRHLREKEKLSQQKLADNLTITRGRLAKYEEGVNEPPLDVLMRLSKYFHVSIDILISVDLERIPIEDLIKLDGNRVLLPIQVNEAGDNMIEVVSHKARAGYLSGYSDPEFIENLQEIKLPFVIGGKHRAFPITGDSMPPLKEGSFVVGSYVESLNDIVDGRTYVIVSKSEGITYKRVYYKSEGSKLLHLHSDNPLYKPFTIKPEDAIEIWEFTCSINTSEYQADDLNIESIREMFRQLKVEISKIN